MRATRSIGALALAIAGAAYSQTSWADPVIVTPDNFVRAETDLNFGDVVKNGGLGKFIHHREPIAVDKQFVIRPNRDTLYSMSVFDLDAGPVTVALPDAGSRFMAMQVINQDHCVPAVRYGAGSYAFTREQIGTRYMGIGIRTLVDSQNPADIEQVSKLQDAIKVEQQSSGRFETPDWDQASRKKVREALLALGATLPDLKRAFGSKRDVDPVRHLIGTAMGWGGNPDEDAVYLNVTPAKNDGATIHKLAIPGHVPVDAFWSITVYNADGYLQANPYNAYSLNNITAQKNADGAVTVQFGGCDGKTRNCLPIVPGWNYLVRLYRPRAEILDGKWKFPEAQAVN
jgi:hypothetical protein